MNKKTIIIILSLIILLVIINIVVFNNHTISVTESSIVNKEGDTLNVLVIEINPTIESITNNSVYPNNNGHPRVSDYLNGVESDNNALNELIEDLEYSSHGKIKINYTKEILNEYIKYTSTLTLSNGTTSNSLDEATLISSSNGVNNANRQENLNKSTVASQIGTNTFNYEYYINKYDLVNKRNNGEFDQVWFLTYEPASTYEITLVGSTSFEINGNYIAKDCDDFLIANISTYNRDSNFHHLMHGMEAIMSKVYNTSYTKLNTSNAYDIYKESKLSDLNEWEKFSLTLNNNNNSYTGVGTLHYPANATQEYDYTSGFEVKSNYEAWNDFPNYKMSFTTIKSSAWNNDDNIASLKYSDNKSAERLYARWWAYNIPHNNDFTKDGYYNNWWKYFTNLNYITDITNLSSIEQETSIGEKIKVSYRVDYLNGDTEIFDEILEGSNITIEDTSIVNYKDGYLVGIKEGKSEVTINFFGKSTIYEINVTGNNGKENNTEESTSSASALIITKSTAATTTTEEIEASPETDSGTVNNNKKIMVYGITALIVIIGLILSIITYKVVAGGGEYNYEDY